MRIEGAALPGDAERRRAAFLAAVARIVAAAVIADLEDEAPPVVKLDGGMAEPARAGGAAVSRQEQPENPQPH